MQSQKGAEMSPSSTIGQDVNPLRVARLQTVMMYRYLGNRGRKWCKNQNDFKILKMARPAGKSL
jgi:hypothetical protein